GVLHAIAGLVRAADIEVEVGINSALLQLGDPEVETVELIFVERTRVVLGVVDDAARCGQIEEVQAHAVDAEARERRGPHRSVFFRRKHHTAAAPVGDVDAPESQALAVAGYEMSVGNVYESALAGWRI